MGYYHLVDSQYTYGCLYDSTEEANKQATKEIEEMRTKAQEQHEDCLISGSLIVEVQE